MTLDAWLKSAAQYLIDVWGLDPSFADSVALFLAYLYSYSLHPVITSGFRDPQKQAELLRRWEEGDPGIVVKPAKISKHGNTRLGRPASLAVDISTNNHQVAAQIAEALGISSGIRFKTPDPVHFYI